MSINFGTSALSKLYYGSTEITKVYSGTSLVYEVTTGGGDGRLFATESATDYAYELDPDTLVVLNTSATAYTGTPYGIGGIIDRLYLSNQSNDNIYELDPDTLLSINSYYESSLFYGLGGTADTLYSCHEGTYGGKVVGIYQIDPDTLAYSTTYWAQPYGSPRGIGGTYDRLFMSVINAVNTTQDNIAELDTTTGLVIVLHVFMPDGAADTHLRGIGGTNSRLYITNAATDKIYEIDPDTCVVLNESASQVIGGSPTAVGGIKSYITPPTTTNLYNINTNGMNYYPDSSYNPPINTRSGNSYTINTYTNAHTGRGFTLDLDPSTSYTFQYTNTNGIDTVVGVYRNEAGFTFDNRANYFMDSDYISANGSANLSFITHSTIGKTFISVNTSGATGGAVITNISVTKN